jgi:hypothetical protein
MTASDCFCISTFWLDPGTSFNGRRTRMSCEVPKFCTVTSVSPMPCSALRTFSGSAAWP